MGRQPETAGEFRSLEILSIRPPSRWVTDILLALLIIGFSVAPMPGEGVLRPEPLTLVFVGLAISLLPLRRRFPATTLVLSVAFFTVVALDGIMSAGSAMAVAIMVFNYNNRLPRRRGMIVALAIITLILALSIPSILADDFSPVWCNSC
ncbi:hypothetical protein G7066_14935 [Leucobacter coleopterorum]|uniref:Uncharacterized protein n=1 Tax=Leucobacter coleopterorum TaxID=2714933 RepID=A0ABX6JZ83_9MICO|nr:hypothetical protein [Leucobacter coleopterorum]QIM19547.1 hypothetical protein G7066_14935 [Leucobacter coleopterorum]